LRSDFAFNFNLRRYAKGWIDKGWEKTKALGTVLGPLHPIVGENLAMLKAVSKLDEAGWFTRNRPKLNLLLLLLCGVLRASTRPTLNILLLLLLLLLLRGVLRTSTRRVLGRRTESAPCEHSP